MFSLIGPTCADPAALFEEETRIRPRACQGKKPHQGFAGENRALFLGQSVSNSASALGFEALAVENRVRSRCTGKERDAESGLDYFGARYYSNGLGRFITADWSVTPVPVPYADRSDPQTLNQYGYVRNIPTVLVDTDGHHGRPAQPIDCSIQVTRCAAMQHELERKDKERKAEQKREHEAQLRAQKEIKRIYNHPAVQAYIMVFFFKAGGEAEEGVAAGTEEGVAGAENATAEAVRAAQEAIDAEVNVIVNRATSAIGNEGAQATTREVAEQAAKEWVGPGARNIVDRQTGKIVGRISADGSRVARFTSVHKPQPYINLVNRATGGNLHVRF